MNYTLLTHAFIIVIVIIAAVILTLNGGLTAPVMTILGAALGFAGGGAVGSNQ